MDVYVSKRNKALAVPRSPGMERLFPEGKALDDKRWVIGHDLGTYTLLTKLGLRIPNPMACYYDWNEGHPFNSQRITCSLLVSNTRAYILNDMGTGKTRTVLWAWDYLRRHGYCGKLLIACKLSNMGDPWGRESFNVVPGKKVVYLHGSKKQRLERLKDEDAEIFVVNHDGLKVIRNELRDRKDIDVLCIDELATYRNKNERSTMMAKFAEHMKFVWGLTGSPMPHGPLDVWMQCRIITPHTVPRYMTHARDALMTKSPHSAFKWDLKPDAIKTAYGWMQPAVRFTLDDVTELPDTVTREIETPLSVQQRNAYAKVAAEYHAIVGTKQINAVNAAAKLNKLLQIAGGFVYATDFSTIKLDCDNRKQQLFDLIRSATNKVLVFFPFRHMVKGIVELVPTKGEDAFDFAIVHGDVSAPDRRKIFAEFQNTDKFKAIFAHPGCMSHGLTLTRANTVIWYCPIMSYELYEQANARIRRVGQQHRQQVIHLYGTPVERKLYKMLENKALKQEELLNLFEEATKEGGY
jgi:SNF2 family DNA or RNA helicase